MNILTITDPAQLQQAIAQRLRDDDAVARRAHNAVMSAAQLAALEPFNKHLIEADAWIKASVFEATAGLTDSTDPLVPIVVSSEGYDIEDHPGLDAGRPQNYETASVPAQRMHRSNLCRCTRCEFGLRHGELAWGELRPARVFHVAFMHFLVEFVVCESCFEVMQSQLGTIYCKD